MREVFPIIVLTVAACAASPTDPSIEPPGDDAGLETDAPSTCVPECAPGTCADDGCGGACACEAGSTCTSGVCESAPSPTNPVLFVFDQELDAILRLEDLDEDGVMEGPLEVTRFFDSTIEVTGTVNAQGLVALGPSELLATDNQEPANVVWLHDDNGDGDALDEGESAVWFSGALPGGGQLTFPTELTVGPDGAIYLMDGNTLNLENPEAIYRCVDANGDGDVDDAGEVENYATLSPPGESAMVTFSAAFRDDGSMYVLDIKTNEYDPLNYSIDRVRSDGGGVTEWLTSGMVVGLTRDPGPALRLSSGASELVFERERQELIFYAMTYSGGSHLMAVRDHEYEGLIGGEPEARIVWSETAHGETTGSPRDLTFGADGSLYYTDNLRDQVLRLVDEDADGAWMSTGEQQVLYRADDAAALGELEIRTPMTIAVYPAADTPGPR